MKKLISIVLSLILILGCSLFLFACDDPPADEVGLTFVAVKEEGSAVGYAVSGASKAEDGNLVIPSKHGNLPVIEIAENAFVGSDWMTSVTIPQTVTRIGANAFARCENLERVEIDDIGQWCNIEFESLASNPMYFAQKLYLNGNPVTNLRIPDSVTRIPDYAFYECESITEVTVGESVTVIGESAFYNCENLKKVVLNGKIESMPSLAFGHCEALEELQIGDRVEEIGYYAFYECSALKEVTIPSSVKSIGESAFSMCSNLKKINLNEGLEYIGDCAFVGCASLEELIMPNSVTEIGFGILMFTGSYMFESGAADGTCSIKKIVISDNLTVIPQFSFSQCTMPTITIGKSVEIIDYSAFYGCEWLESVVLPKSVTQIVSYAFYRCPLLDTFYYEGTAEELSEVTIGRNGNEITADKMYYYSEEEPNKNGNFWHYAPDGVTPEKW